MFSLYLTCNKVFIMDEYGNVKEGSEGCLRYNDRFLNFVEYEGLYAYSEFFREGDWPDEYYDDGEKVEQYHGIRLKMICGNWYTMKNLIKVIGSDEMSEWREKTRTCIFDEIQYEDFDKKLEESMLSLKKNKFEGVSTTTF